MLEKEPHSLCTFDLQDWLSAVLGVGLWLLLREYLQPFQERKRQNGENWMVEGRIKRLGEVVSIELIVTNKFKGVDFTRKKRRSRKVNTCNMEIASKYLP